MPKRDLNKVGKQTIQTTRKIQTLRENNSRIIRIKNAKFSGYYFCMN